MYTFLLVLALAAFGLLAHIAQKNPRLQRALRLIILLVGIGEAVLLVEQIGHNSHDSFILAITCLMTFLILFRPFRQVLSWFFTGLNVICTGRILLTLIRKKERTPEFLLQRKIFQPDSFPHLMAAFIYISAAGYLLSNIYPQDRPFSFDHFFLFNGVALAVLAFCGVGICITRSGKETLARLGLRELDLAQISLAMSLIVLGFAYDALWAVYTHHLAGQDLATQFSGYTVESFGLPGGFIFAVIVTMITAAGAGIGEELITRGAMQPVFGILPTAFLHGIVHAHLAHSPAFLVKATIWSMIMGVLRRYTNTTTTILAHVGFNVLTIFLFACNP